MTLLKNLFLLASATSTASAFLVKNMKDKNCANGVRSIPKGPDDITVCCPAYCGRCNDYDTCKKVNGQDSKDACCASNVKKLACENNAEDPYCYKSCDVKSAPCSLGVVKKFVKPAETSAAGDCAEDKEKGAGEAFEEKMKGAVEGAGGAEQWKSLKTHVAKFEAENGLAAAQETAEELHELDNTVKAGQAELKNMVSDLGLGDNKEISKDMAAFDNAKEELEADVAEIDKTMAESSEQLGQKVQRKELDLLKKALNRIGDEARKADEARKELQDNAERIARELKEEAERKLREAAAETERKAREAAERIKRELEEAARKARELAEKLNPFKWR